MIKKEEEETGTLKGHGLCKDGFWRIKGQICDCKEIQGLICHFF